MRQGCPCTVSHSVSVHLPALRAAACSRRITPAGSRRCHAAKPNPKIMQQRTCAHKKEKRASRASTQVRPAGAQHPRPAKRAHARQEAPEALACSRRAAARCLRSAVCSAPMPCSQGKLVCTGCQSHSICALRWVARLALLAAGEQRTRRRQCSPNFSSLSWRTQALMLAVPLLDRRCSPPMARPPTHNRAHAPGFRLHGVPDHALVQTRPALGPSTAPAHPLMH